MKNESGKRKTEWVFVFLLVLFGLVACAQEAAVTPTPPPLAIPPPAPTPGPLAVTNVAVTTDGAVWYSFGTFSFPGPGGGVKRFYQGETTLFGLEEGLPGESIQRLEVAPDGVLWAGAGCGVAFFDGEEWKTVSEGCEQMVGNVLDFAFTPDGSTWIAVGLDLWRYYQGSFVNYERLANFLAVDDDGSLWMSGWEGRQGSGYVARFNGVDWEKQESPTGGLSRIFQGPDGRIWGERRDLGMVRLTDKAWEEVFSAEAFPFETLISFDFTPEGTLWATTKVGLAAFGDEGWRVYRQAPAGAISVAAAADGSLWLGTNRGEVVQFRSP